MKICSVIKLIKLDTKLMSQSPKVMSHLNDEVFPRMKGFLVSFFHYQRSGDQTQHEIV